MDDLDSYLRRIGLDNGVTPTLAREQLPEVLAECFDLPGFALAADGRRLVRAEG